jgi:hypothetical protein
MQEGVHKESDNWKEEQHACMGGRPNVGRVRVLVIYCKWTEEPEIYKYRYVGIIGGSFLLVQFCIVPS